MLLRTRIWQVGVVLFMVFVSMSPMHDGARLARRHVLLSVSWRQRIHRLCSRCVIDDVMEKCGEDVQVSFVVEEV